MAGSRFHGVSVSAITHPYGVERLQAGRHRPLPPTPIGRSRGARWRKRRSMSGGRGQYKGDGGEELPRWARQSCHLVSWPEREGKALTNGWEACERGSRALASHTKRLLRRSGGSYGTLRDGGPVDDASGSSPWTRPWSDPASCGRHKRRLRLPAAARAPVGF
jgi:hypothetical protein